MKYSFTIGGGDPCVREYPVYDAGTSINKGALIAKGVTDDTSESFGVLSLVAATDVLGVVEELVDTADTDSLADGTNIRMAKISINPMNVYLVEYDQTDTFSETSASSSTTFNCTSLEADIAGGWLFAISGAAAGELQWIVSDTTNVAVTKSAFTTTGGSDTFIKILPELHLVIDLNATLDKMGSTAAAGTGEAVVLANYIQADTIPFQRLDPTKHSGLDLTGLNAKFFAEVLFRNHILNPLS